jgi:hypothetical protein
MRYSNSLAVYPISNLVMASGAKRTGMDAAYMNWKDAWWAVQPGDRNSFEFQFVVSAGVYEDVYETTDEGRTDGVPV